MTKQRICGLAGACIVLLSGCVPCFQPSARLSGPIENAHTIDTVVRVPRTTAGIVDIDTLLSDVGEEVQNALSGAYLSGMLFSGKATDLATLDGTIVFAYTDVRYRVLYREITLVFARVETEQGTLRIRTMDATDRSISMDRLEIDKYLPLEDIAAIALAQLQAMGLQEHVITLTRLQREPWVLVCNAIGTPQQGCSFEIDATTGEITDTGQ